ncbi:DUF461 domain-containing protein [Kitasatospora sp. NPDC059571]|uniref:DUF461 domain-containing protein n=1 Tax=Kitasatospora sp. NPDC059571 TaxID=3346871 RepID=UPI0036B6088D
MSRSLRRGAIAALVLAAILPLSACATGNDAATLEIKPDNAATSIGTTLRLNNILVVTPARTAAEGAAEATTPANITVNISNTGSAPEVLQSIEVAGAGSATFTDAKGAALSEIVIPVGGSVLLGGEGQPAAHLAPAKLPVGGYADTTFSFKTAGKAAVPAGVRPATGLYASFGPKAEPTASATASATAAASPSAGASASATATGSATASATATGTGTATATGTASPSASAH